MIGLKDNDAVFSPKGVHRYVLSRRVRDDGFKLLWVMLNPSRAGAHDDDSTIRICRGFSFRLGAALLRVVNLYSLIETYSSKLKNAKNLIGPAADDHIIESALWSDRILCAWGNGAVGDKKRVLQVFEMLECSGGDISCLGITGYGHPKHPLRISYSTGLLPYTTDGIQK